MVAVVRKAAKPGEAAGLCHLGDTLSVNDPADINDCDLKDDRPQIGWRCVSVNTTGMGRTRGDKWKVLPVVAAHLLRQGDDDFRAKHPYNQRLSQFNTTSPGHGTVDAVVSAAHPVLAQAAGREQVNNVMTWTFVFVLPMALGSCDSKWHMVLAWLSENPVTAGLPVALWTVHRDQPGCAHHLHVALLPIRNGVRTRRPVPSLLRGLFAQFVHEKFGVRVDSAERRREARRTKTCGDIAASPGRGPKSRRESERRDSALMSQIDPATGDFVPMRCGLASYKNELPEISNRQFGSNTDVKFSFTNTGVHDDFKPERITQKGHTSFSPTADPSPSRPADCEPPSWRKAADLRSQTLAAGLVQSPCGKDQFEVARRAMLALNNAQREEMLAALGILAGPATSASKSRPEESAKQRHARLQRERRRLRAEKMDAIMAAPAQDRPAMLSQMEREMKLRGSKNSSKAARRRYGYVTESTAKE